MAYNEDLAHRIRKVLLAHTDVAEKRMFGGLAFLWQGHMFVGVVGDELMARVGKPHHAQALLRPHARTMDFTGKPMQGYVFVAPAGLTDDAGLAQWVLHCQSFVATLPAKAVPKPPKPR
jgi:TfoX N-terminal domain